MAISTVTATINGQSVTLTLNSTTGKYEATVTAPSASSYQQSGHYFPVTITATDTASNVTTADPSHATLGDDLKLYVKEQVKPTITFLTPTNGAHVINATPTITFRLLDNGTQSTGFSGIDTSTCVVKINGTTASGATFSAITGGYEGSLTPSSAIADGSCTVTIDVDDFDGNSADTASITFTIDTVAPTLTVTSPTDNLETNQDTVTVTGSTSDATSTPVTITISLNGTDQGTVTLDGSGNFSKSVTLAQQASNTIVVVATDAAGKTTTVTRTVTHNAIGPVIKSVVINPNPVNAGQTYTITVEVE
ncbi:MAG: hypothetical protein IKN72_06375 [Clostridia bacterium]|nr:hypothetical protein [Clostridia bacterium]